MDFALQTNQLKSHSKYPLTWTATAILSADCMMQAFYNTAAKEEVDGTFDHLLKFPDSNDVSSFACIFTLALLDITEFEAPTPIWWKPLSYAYA